MFIFNSLAALVVQWSNFAMFLGQLTTYAIGKKYVEIFILRFPSFEYRDMEWCCRPIQCG